MSPVESYLAELTSRLHAVLAAELVGVYAGGSYALGEFEQGRSDLDVAVVARAPVSGDVAQEVVARLRHEALPCPARGLELVVYPLEVTRSGRTAPGFSLNLNSGAGMPFRAELEPQAGEEHWFAIDRSILAERGVALIGPPAREVFAPIPRAALLPVVVRALEWHAPGAARGDDIVLNAARSLRWALEGSWASKREAGRWAVDTRDDAEVVAQALAARDGDGSVDAAEAERFRLSVLARLRTLDY
jgi:predicted nucleotidyltransferase